MILALLAAVSLAAAEPSADQSLTEASIALEAGRVEQARLMIGAAVKAGAQGAAIDRLLADLAFATGDYKSALPRYHTLLAAGVADVRMYERAGIAALKLRDFDQGTRLLDKATSFPNASWRAWDARAVAADFSRDWGKADDCYNHALALAPAEAELLNNQGWSYLVRGRWADALTSLGQAAAINPKSERIANNLELARAAVAEGLPQRRDGESESDWAARLNDAGVIARLQGNNKKAVAAFAQAIEARSQWFERAANNLAMVERSK
jgi:Flp pilus assembly protein TadD